MSRFIHYGISLLSICLLIATASHPAGAQTPPVVPKIIFHHRPLFIIGLYNYPIASGASTQSDSSLKEIAAAGFNTLLQYDHDAAWERRQPALNQDFLNRAGSYGLAVVDELWTYNLTSDNWIGMPTMLAPESPLGEQVKLLKSNPNLLGYETFDEAAGYRGVKEASLQLGYEFLKSVDPDHPVLSNENPINSLDQAIGDRSWIRIGDTLSCDWYPVDPTWTRPPWPLYGVPNNMDYLHLVAPDRPIYMVLQGCPIAGASPSLSDCRNMMYRVIIHGAAGCLWWGTYQLKPDDQLWQYIKICAGELRALEPILESGDQLGSVRHDSALDIDYMSPNLKLGNPKLEAVAYKFSQPNGTVDNYVIVANTSADEIVKSTVVVRGWNTARNGRRIRVLFETDGNGNSRASIPKSGSGWVDTFTPNAVHVYTDAKFNRAPCDFDGDGVPDKVAYSRSSGEIEITFSSNGKEIFLKCGTSPKLVAGDVDGDGKADIGVYNPAARNYTVLLSTENYTKSRVVTNLKGSVIPQIP